MLESGYFSNYKRISVILLHFQELLKEVFGNKNELPERIINDFKSIMYSRPSRHVLNMNLTFFLALLSIAIIKVRVSGNVR